ncbi:hypothetical protein [Neorhizobium galegae]|uniref:hypothetical protein n=1 Tax=Neorhizobium galegae TaxID=399 RepID=UPI00351E5E62|nr:immunity 53 family protein [Neorhizobium galegae]
MGTLDNPGWLLKGDLAGTDCDGRTLDRISHNCEMDVLDGGQRVSWRWRPPVTFGRFLRRFETGQRATARMAGGTLTPQQIPTHAPNEAI